MTEYALHSQQETRRLDSRTTASHLSLRYVELHDVLVILLLLGLGLLVAVQRKEVFPCFSHEDEDIRVAGVAGRSLDVTLLDSGS